LKTSLLMRLSPLVLAAALAGGVAFAQSAPPAPPPPPGGERMHHEMGEHMRAMEEAKARDLHIALNIRPDQEAAWQAFGAAMHPHMDGERHEGRPDAAAMASMTTPQGLDMMEAKMAEHLAAFHRRNEAIKQFYAALSPEQQKVFDALARLHHREMGGGMMHGMHGHHGGGMEHGEGGMGEE